MGIGMGGGGHRAAFWVEFRKTKGQGKASRGEGGRGLASPKHTRQTHITTGGERVGGPKAILLGEDARVSDDHTLLGHIAAVGGGSLDLADDFHSLDDLAKLGPHNSGSQCGEKKAAGHTGDGVEGGRQRKGKGKGKREKAREEMKNRRKITENIPPRACHPARGSRRW